MVKTIEQEQRSLFDLKKVLKGSIISIIVSAILLVVFSLILTYTNVPEGSVDTVIIIITGISILIGGQLTTRNLRKNGILNGMLVGAIYMVILYLVSSILTQNFSFNNISSFIMLIVGMLTGAIGGIIGVNNQ